MRAFANPRISTRASQPSSKLVQAPLLLIGRETIKQAISSRAAQICLAAAPLGPARGVRRIPRPRRLVVAQAFAVDMSDHRSAGAGFRPIAAGAILIRRKRAPVRLRPGQNVVVIGGIA